MPTLLIIPLASILALLWNILTVFYLARKARKGMLSALRFSLVFILGFSITVSSILFMGVAANGIDLREIGFAIFVFMLNLLVGFPVVYYLSRFLMGSTFPNGLLRSMNRRGANSCQMRKTSEEVSNPLPLVVGSAGSMGGGEVVPEPGYIEEK